MTRITGIDLNDNWKLDFALTKIKGIGWSTSSDIVSTLKLKPKMKVGDLSKDEAAKIAAAVDKYQTEGDLARKVQSDVRRMQTIGSYRGLRHSKGLPARGQRTKSNARTKRGKRKTVGSYKKEALAKQSN